MLREPWLQGRRGDAHLRSARSRRLVRRVRLPRAAGLAIVLALFGGAGAHAQAPIQPVPGKTTPNENTTVNVNYVYAANLGFGGYSVGGLTANVYTLPLGHTFALNDRGVTMRVLLPVQFGVYNFQGSVPNGPTFTINQQSIAAVPGVEFGIPVPGKILLKPFVFGGAGHTFGDDTGNPNAWIYTFGVRATRPWQVGRYTLTVGAALLYAGDASFKPGFSETYSALELGLEVRRPLGFSIGHLLPDLGVFVAGFHYPNKLDFSRFLAPTLHVGDQAEVGFSIGSAAPFDMLWFSNPRIGAGYVWGDGVQVWHLVLGFPF